MVRLEEMLRCDFFTYQLDFNSSLVRLEEELKTQWSYSETDFNSSLVRLEVFAKFVFVKVDFLFQFLFGAIGSESLAGKRELWNEFQFLFGAIGRGLDNTGLQRGAIFQFLFGAIGRRDFHALIPPVFLISIPLWCDWKTLER